MPSSSRDTKAQVATALSAHGYATRYAGRGSSFAGAAEQGRRQQPRLWDSDWLLLNSMRRHIAAIAARVSRNGAVAIDFGCGSRPYEAFFTAAGVDYRGADIGGKAEIMIDDAGRLMADDRSADLLLSFQVLEHVRDLDLYLGEARRVLKDDATMILSTHGVWLYHPHPEDHRRWTREGLVNEISARGFEVLECVPVVGPLAWTTMVRLTCACYALKGLPLVGNLLAGFLAVLMNLRGVVEDRITPPWVTRENACVYITLSRRAEAKA